MQEQATSVDISPFAPNPSNPMPGYRNTLIADPPENVRQWMREEFSKGIWPNLLLEQMIRAGWFPQVAQTWLLREFQFMPQPRPQLGETDISIENEGRTISLVMQSIHPRLCVFDDFLTEEECDHLIDLGRPLLKMNGTVDTNNPNGAILNNDVRSSEGAFLGRGEDSIVSKVEKRIADVFNWPVEFGEDFQIQRYKEDSRAKYVPHYDYFDPGAPSTRAIEHNGGNRVGTVLLYLNTPFQGGATVFPHAGLRIAPKKGRAVYFAYPVPDPETLSFHGGEPLFRGDKWIATKWLRQGRTSNGRENLPPPAPRPLQIAA